MPSFVPRSRPRKLPPARVAIESLESRAYFSSGVPELSLTVPGPVPTSGIAGTKLNANIEINIANNGTGPAKGKFTLTLYASTDAVLSNDDAQLVFKPNKSLNIPAGTNKNIKLKVGVLPQNLNGSYFILGAVTGPLPEVVASSQTTIAIGPAEIDLADMVTSVPTIGHVGKKIRVTVVVSNVGNTAAKGSLTTDFALSTSSTGSNSIDVGTPTPKHINIKPGKSQTLHLSVPIPLGSPTGNQFVVATVDPNNGFLEPNLANNTNVSLMPVSFS